MFVAGLLEHMNPWPLPHSVIVMDNVVIHKVEGIQEMIEERGLLLLYLPPYSPDLNPIEEAFSSMKAWLRANCDDIQDQLEGNSADPYAVLWEAIYRITTVDAHGWYHHSSYIV